MDEKRELTPEERAEQTARHKAITASSKKKPGTKGKKSKKLTFEEALRKYRGRGINKGSTKIKGPDPRDTRPRKVRHISGSE